ncbi:CHAP domain-containing protein [Novosphingobium sp. ZN18A2]|uniref:CHAP domain-containing protein n=1 Tax=Novosphingobium sp. ZN18A2 TaxID=3079861 RepID=UPI0030CF44C5
MGSHTRSGISRTLSCKLRSVIALLSLFTIVGFPAAAEAGVLQCVPYARRVSGIEIHGNARTWWGQAAGTYARGNEPEVGAVLAFKGTRAMPYGHVATVARVIDERHILLNHANWSRPGMIEHDALAVDVSDAGDWSRVRVWFAPIGDLGSRENPTFGFIYDAAPGEGPKPLDDDIQLAAAEESVPAPVLPQTAAIAAAPRMVLASSGS